MHGAEESARISSLRALQCERSIERALLSANPVRAATRSMDHPGGASAELCCYTIPRRGLVMAVLRAAWSRPVRLTGH